MLNAGFSGVDHYGWQTLQHRHVGGTMHCRRNAQKKTVKQSRGSWVAQCTPEEMSRNNLAGCSPFLKPETLVPRKHAIVHMGSGQHGQVLGFTKCRHDLPDNLSLLHRRLGTF